MKRKTLQEQYNQIKKGKGNKEIFLKEAKRVFPNYIPNMATFNQAETILKQKSIISENTWGVATGKNEQPDWFKVFNENINIISEEAKVEEKKTSKEVTDLAEKNFDYKDKKDVNNVYGEAFLKGYYTEMKDPKNTDKTIDELKEIVAKNLAKDQLHYVKDGQFGEKGVGYTDEHPGLKASKSDQMEKVKLQESKNITEGKKYFGVFRKGGSIGQGNGKPLYSFVDKEEAKQKAKRLRQTLTPGEKSYYGMGYIVKPTDVTPELVKENLETHDSKKAKPKKKKPKKETIETKLAEIDKASSIVALETKIEALAEIIESKMQRLSMVSEDENLSELMDKKKIKEMQKEIKLLEKRKAGFEKLYEKSCGKKYQQQEIVGEDYDPDEEQLDDEDDIPWPVDDEGLPLGESKKKDEFKVGDIVNLDKQDKEYKITNKRKTFGSKKFAYSIEDMNGKKVGEYGEDQLSKVKSDKEITESKKNKWPEVVNSRYNEYKFELEKIMSDRAKYKVIDVETGKEEPGGRIYGTPSQLQSAADDLIKPSGGKQSSQF